MGGWLLGLVSGSVGRVGQWVRLVGVSVSGWLGGWLVAGWGWSVHQFVSRSVGGREGQWVGG